jgi:hypothetical protein
MNPFTAWLDRASASLSAPAAWAIFLAGAGIYLINAWRVRFLILIAQYFFVGIAREQARRQSEEPNEDARTNIQRPFLWASNLPFRILSLIVMTVVAYLATEKYPLPFISTDLALACFILIILAVLFIGTEENDVMIVGVGVLNLLAALDLFYSAQDPGLLVTGLLVMVNLLVGLAISYLAVVEVAE